MKRVDRDALLQATVLATWAGVFWFLTLTNRWALFLSTRTRWVLPLGAVILSLGAIGRLVSVRSREPTTLSPRALGGLAVVVAPALVVLALPPTTLTGFALSHRSSFNATYLPTETSTTGQPSLVEVAGARYSPDAMKQLAKNAGEEVTYEGMVHHDADAPGDQFFLIRFIVTCCVSDALVAQLRVVGAPQTTLHENQWVRVQGRIFPLRRDIILLAEDVTKIATPSHPYITP